MNVLSRIFRRQPAPQLAEAAQREERARLVANLVVQHGQLLAIHSAQNSATAEAIENLMVLGGHKPAVSSRQILLSDQTAAIAANADATAAELRALLGI